MKKDYLEVNKGLWNGLADINYRSEFYDVESFVNGKSSLNYVELDALGDVIGKSLLHLQCHFGMDSLSWARMGASVTGVDMSDKAINYARELNDKLGLDAKFINCDVYSVDDHVKEKFDIIYTSYGVTGWLPDLEKWAKVISNHLKPGGVFFLAEFHPLLFMWNKEYSEIKYPYFNKEMIVEVNKGSYADWENEFEHETCEFSHTISYTINSLINAGLEVISFEEYPFSFYNCFNRAVKGEDGFWYIKGMQNKIPLMFSIKAIKK